MNRILFVLLLFTHVGLMAQREQSSLKVGEKAPSFEAMDQYDDLIKSEDVLQSEQLIVVFYRGQWCPFCNKHLKHLQDHVKDFTKAGARLVAVSPEIPVNIDKTVEKTNAKYSILYDKNNQIMKEFGVDFVLPENLQQKYLEFGIDLKQANGNDNQMLPVPATYVIGKDGIIKYIHYDPNYKNRSSADEILKHL